MQVCGNLQDSSKLLSSRQSSLIRDPAATYNSLGELSKAMDPSMQKQTLESSGFAKHLNTLGVGKKSSPPGIPKPKNAFVPGSSAMDSFVPGPSAFSFLDLRPWLAKASSFHPFSPSSWSSHQSAKAEVNISLSCSDKGTQVFYSGIALQKTTVLVILFFKLFLFTLFHTKANEEALPNREQPFVAELDKIRIKLQSRFPWAASLQKKMEKQLEGINELLAQAGAAKGVGSGAVAIQHRTPFSNDDLQTAIATEQ